MTATAEPEGRYVDPQRSADALGRLGGLVGGENYGGIARSIGSIAGHGLGNARNSAVNAEPHRRRLVGYNFDDMVANDAATAQQEPASVGREALRSGGVTAALGAIIGGVTGGAGVGGKLIRAGAGAAMGGAVGGILGAGAADDKNRRIESAAGRTTLREDPDTLARERERYIDES